MSWGYDCPDAYMSRTLSSAAIIAQQVCNSRRNTEYVRDPHCWNTGVTRGGCSEDPEYLQAHLYGTNSTYNKNTGTCGEYEERSVNERINSCDNERLSYIG